MATPLFGSFLGGGAPLPIQLYSKFAYCARAHARIGRIRVLHTGAWTESADVQYGDPTVVFKIEFLSGDYRN